MSRKCWVITDINLGETGSLNIGDDANRSFLDSTGLTVTGDLGTTIINPGFVQIGDATNNIIIDGSAGTIGGLTNTSFVAGSYTGEAAGQAATQGQLQDMGNMLNLTQNADGLNVIQVNGNEYADLSAAFADIHWNTDVSSGTGPGTSTGTGSGTATGGTGSGGTSSSIHYGDTVTFVAGSNILIDKVPVSGSGDTDIKIGLNPDLQVNSVTAETVSTTTVNATTVNATSINANSIAIGGGGPIINQDGINMGGNRITNVGPGVEGTDAVNVDQLMGVGNNLQNQISGVRHDMKRLENRSNAGIAAAMATAGLPQAYLPGKSMVAVAGGVWRGESGMAIGVSTVSENGKWILKGSANTSGRGGAGGTIGAGYQW